MPRPSSSTFRPKASQNLNSTVSVTGLAHTWVGLGLGLGFEPELGLGLGSWSGLGLGSGLGLAHTSNLYRAVPCPWSGPMVAEVGASDLPRSSSPTKAASVPG